MNKPKGFRFGFLIWLALWLLIVGALVWLSYPTGALVFASTSCLSLWVWNTLQAQRLHATLEQLDTSLSTVPSAPGLWGEIFYVLYRRNRSWQQQIQQAQSQQQRFMQAIQASPNAFVMLDDGGRVEWINQAAQGLLGLDPVRDIGQHLAYLLRTPTVSALLDSQRLREPMSLHINDKFIKVQAFPYGEAQTLLLGQDLTELERTDQVRRDFIANVSHELRTPLTVLTGYNELLQDYAQSAGTDLPSGVTEALAHIAQHTQRMNTLTQDLLQLANLEASDEVPAQDHIDINVNDWLTRTEDATRMINSAVHLSFTRFTENVHIKGSSKELDSALINLVSNALRYTQNGGSVTVHCEAVHKKLIVRVSDTGCGIAAQHIPRLTERFYRVSASRSRDSGGTGLGLAIVKHILLRHRGELQIESVLGKGSTFSLILPL